MALSDIVDIVITSDSVGVARTSFGTPLILSNTASWAERVRSYTDLAGVLADFAADSPEALSATALFAQNPHPKTIKIGRAALPATQVYLITPVAADDSDYVFRVSGEGVTEETTTFTSDSSALLSEVTLGITTALNAVVGRNYTAVDGGTYVTVTATAAGDWFAIEQVSAAVLGTIEQTHVDPGVATDLAAIALEDADWGVLLTHFNSSAYVLAAAVWIETQEKLYICDLNDTRAVTTALAAGTDPIDALHTLARERTAVMYHHKPDQFAASAWVGKVTPNDPGSATWFGKTLSGVSATTLTSTERGRLVAKSGNFYTTIAGVNVTQMGTAASGEYIDVVRGDDWVADDMAKRIFATIAGRPKIPYTDEGVALIENDMRATLKIAVDRDIYASFVITVPLVADVDDADKIARLLPDMKFSAVRSGAVQKVNVTGVVSV